VSNEVADRIFDYDLTEKIPYCGTIKDAPNINFKKDSESITGFTITIKNHTRKEAEAIAENKSEKLKEILVVKSHICTEVIYRGDKTIPKLGEPTTVYGIYTTMSDIALGIIDLDLNESTVHNLINPNNSFNSELLYHVSKGICQFNNKNYEESIKEIVKAIEDNQSIWKYNEYLILRDMLSHLPTTKRIAKEFDTLFANDKRFNFTYNEDPYQFSIDIKSEQNQLAFKEKASEFIAEMKKYLNLF
jgi:hypothetical protein